MPRKKELSFEEALGRMNEIADQMEQGDLPLKDLIANYSEGMKLAGICSQALARAEQAMDLLVQENDGDVETKQLIIEEEGK
ncbi:MAG: exodeoxyribonuclease VII small subunit [Selenomonas sp.]|uniref:exodeoxyribonuclease VII small subunit n=1 Tax=Selenomonas sp. TaxID=2053611 RepID=UPI0025EB579B|nr:exodeoxyribonuclease VII small subunit [Selenomonas sp.]MCI6232967.1 exodeoxyribonuclease VII small subunit [Selenomonas sp.]